jgi:hypothetical protein
MEKLEACVACNKFFIADTRGVVYIIAERRNSLEAAGLVQGHRRLLPVSRRMILYCILAASRSRALSIF